MKSEGGALSCCHSQRFLSRPRQATADQIQVVKIVTLSDNCAEHIKTSVRYRLVAGQSHQREAAVIGFDNRFTQRSNSSIANRVVVESEKSQSSAHAYYVGDRLAPRVRHSHPVGIETDESVVFL